MSLANGCVIEKTADTVRSEAFRNIRSGSNSETAKGIEAQGQRRRDPRKKDPGMRSTGHFLALMLQKISTKRNRFGKGCPPAAFLFRGSLTVEAALVLPLVLFASVAVLFFCRFIQVEWGVQTAMHETVRAAALVGGLLEEPAEGGTDGGGTPGNHGYRAGAVINGTTLGATCRAKILAENTPVSNVLGKIVGISFENSVVTDTDIYLTADYYVKLPLPFPFGRAFHMQNRAYARRFVGYDPRGTDDESEWVYVTPYGKAWHRDISCPYLAPAIRSVTAEQLPGERNYSRHKYKACPDCKGEGFGKIYYITDHGTTYHTRLDCPGLKRTVKREKLTEAEKDHTPCPKCGGSG